MEAISAVIGEPDVKVITTIYTIPVAYNGEMYEFACWVSKNNLITDALPVISSTELRRGRMRKAELAQLIPLVEDKVKSIF
jgi:hypothetical protein